MVPEFIIMVNAILRGDRREGEHGSRRVIDEHVGCQGVAEVSE